MAKKDYALEWYRYGLQNDEDYIFRFMMHWIAFNWLYSECDRNSEIANINAYCEMNYEKLKRYNPFNTEAFKEFRKGPIRGRSGGRSPEDLFDDICNKHGERRVKSMLLTVYRVRCNLFHGTKRIDIERDQELIKSSAIIMEGYLRALLLDDPEF